MEFWWNSSYYNSILVALVWHGVAKCFIVTLMWKYANPNHVLKGKDGYLVNAVSV